MKFLFLAVYLSFASSHCSADGLGGPFLLWGHENVRRIQQNSLHLGEENDFASLYKDAKAIVVFVRNKTDSARLDASQFPKLRELVYGSPWAYIPRRALTVEPFDYNSNVELINLSRSGLSEDEEIVSHFNDAIAIYGKDGVLGLLANSEAESQRHSISKRENKEDEVSTTPASTELDENFIYIAANNKAALYLNNAAIFNISNNGSIQSIRLIEHTKVITFDDYTSKGYSRLSIIFNVEGEKLTLRFRFTISRAHWTMTSVDIDFKEYNRTLTLTGSQYTLPSAPVKFSYRCGAVPLIFRDGSDTLTLDDYQVQPWLNGSTRFGDVYDCVGFTTAPILAGALVSLFLCGILSLGLIALYDIKTPNKFESSRSKQLTFAVSE